jgi:hypothetical protein
VLFTDAVGSDRWGGVIEPTQRVCVKVYAAEDSIPDSTFVPIFHEWIRDRALDLVLLDVADYTHVPDGPGVMLVAHETTFALDRSDGRFGLLAQQRRPISGDAGDAIATTLRQALLVADRLEADRRLAGRLAFDRASIRIEANDRLRSPNGDSGFNALEPYVRSGVSRVYPDASVHTIRLDAPPRERLAIAVRIAAASEAGNR